MDVIFLKGTQAEYDAAVSASLIDDAVFYYTTDQKNVYHGLHKLNNAEDLAAAVQDIAANSAAITLLNNTEATNGSVRYIIKNEYIGNLDGTITGNGKFATLLSETDGVISATMVDLSVADIPELPLSKIPSAGTAAAADVATSAITEESSDNNLVSAAQVSAFVAQEIADLEGAMHFRGVIVRQEGETDAQAIARVIIDPEDGDVVVMSDNAKEYIYTGSAWREVGDEGLYVQKTTTIAGVDLQDNITKSELLSALNVEEGADVSDVQGVQVNGSDLTPDANKKVNITIAEGSTNGTIAVDNVDVAVHGLGSAAYTASTDYDASGSAAAVLGTSSDTSAANTVYGAKAAAADVLGTSGDLATANTVYGAKAAAAAADAKAVTAQGEVDDLETYVGTIPSTSEATNIVSYVDEKAADAKITWGNIPTAPTP